MSKFKKMKLSEARAKFEQIDELDTSTLKSYRTKARAQGNAIVDKMKMGGGDWSKDQKDTKTLRKRAAGAQMSGKQLVKRGESLKTEEAEQIDELSKETLGAYAHKAKDQLGKAEYRAGVKMGTRHMGAKPDAMERAYNVRANKRHAGLTMAIDKLAKEEVEAVAETADGCMTDTSSGGADNITASKTGENYKKTNEKTTGPSPATGTSTHVVAGKTGEAWNTTGITKRVPALESAVLDVMMKSLEKRKIFEDAENIAIISDEQRNDWLEVSKGNMDVVDYFNKYKV